MSESGPRQRKLKGHSTAERTATTSTDQVADEVEDTSHVISILDVFRIIFTLCTVSCALSYYVTSGESVLWGYRPWITRPDLVKAYIKGSVNLTPEELSVYNGTDKSLPIYLAINGTIFDVSAGEHTYGPGGSYHVFAGRDATRAFVTGCFQEDTTGDMRGAELLYIPIDDDDEQISSGEKKTRAEKERREAKKKVQQEVRKWEDFYKKSKKYFEVGKVVGQKEHTGPPPELCEAAAKSRQKRKKASTDA